ncbi:MAG: hypothetical protein EBR82_73100 [Caulobacteraceae bacterium]|nr:hypothetical protein [Caulobacteraceae bacterium]
MADTHMERILEGLYSPDRHAVAEREKWFLDHILAIYEDPKHRHLSYLQRAQAALIEAVNHERMHPYVPDQLSLDFGGRR